MVKMNKETEYKKDLNELKEQILKEGNTLLTKKDLLERFCEIDKEYKGEPWNLLQILANINILIGEKPCKPNTGHWILTDVEYEYNRVWHCNCSKCGKDPIDYIGGSENWWLLENKLPKYCPNCGTKMVESKGKDDNK